MAILLNDSIKVQGGKPVEDKRLNNGTPWESVEQVNQNILPTDRYISLEVLIGDRIYWYKGGVADSDLVEKEMPPMMPPIKEVIKVTVNTARATRDKVGTTTAGNYVPQAGDELLVEFTEGTYVSNPTLSIDGGEAKLIKLGAMRVTSTTLTVSSQAGNEDRFVRMWYDGTHYQLYGATNNSVYAKMPQSHLENVDSDSAYLVSGKILAWIRSWENIIGKPDIETVLLKITNNTNTEDLINNVPQKGKTIVTQGTANIVVTINSEDGFVASYQKSGTGNITFQASGGKTLVQVDGTNEINGAKGSTATVTVVGNEVLLRVSNV
ncbi:hypothetical protein [Capnocytophaga canis]|uniref:hypothetical protein n=1 Tax=Capnocytophaga canis TaxID=1848903 RepID=UPI0037D7965F